MSLRIYMRLCALLVLGLLSLVLAACSGGGDDGDTTPPPGGGIIDTGDDDVPPLVDDDGPIAYPGQQPPGSGGTPTPGVPPAVQPGTYNFGDHIFRLPVDSNGTARVIAENFSPGQKAAFVLVNMHPLYLDARNDSNGNFPLLPETNYSMFADATVKGAASAKGLESADLGPAGTTGLPYTGEIVSPLKIYEREAAASGMVPYAAIPGKTTSVIQKGEIRTFVNTPPREFGPPDIIPGPDEPDRDTEDFEYPPFYNAQDGRLVAIGTHCLIFLSTEINGGHPDSIRFTQARLNRMAREFDTVIFPIATAAFGPVVSYGEGSVYRDVDRNLPPLTGDDFDNNGQLLTPLPGVPDSRLVDEQKIIIFLFNGEEGGFFTFGPAQDENDRDKDVGSTLYIGTDNFPPNESDFNAAFSVMAHEFQHKLYHDHGLPVRQTSYGWFNEGMSMLSMHLCGYTANSGKIIHWAIDSQVVEYLNNVNQAAVPMDANQYFSNQAQYGSGFLFFLYLYEHYDPGVGKRIYNAARLGERDPIKLVEAGAQSTQTLPGTDGTLGTADDQTVVYRDSFQQVYAKFALANFIDGIYAQNSGLFDSRFHYSTIDLRGTVNLSTGTLQLPGVKTEVYPKNGTYPVEDVDRLVYPWGCDYLVFTNGDGRDVEFEFNADRNFQIYMLPVDIPRDPVTGLPLSTNSVTVSAGATMPY